MSIASKIWIAIIVVLIIGGVWWYMSAGTSSVSMAPANSVSSANSSDTELPTASTDDSNTALDADMSSMNAQMGDLNTDTTNVDASVASSSSQ